MMLSLDTAYRSFGGEVEASSTPTICRLSDSRRHQLPAIAHDNLPETERLFVNAVRRGPTKENIMAIYLKYEGIPGEVTEKSHKGWVELRYFEFAGPGFQGFSSSAARGKPVSEAIVTKQMDSTSTPFYREWEWGKGKNATVDFAYDDGTVYWRLEMKDTLVSGFNPGSVNAPIEKLTLNFAKITFTQPAPLKDQKHAAQLVEFQRIQHRMS